ncbi:MAG: ATP-binding cassette domain-containing protein [Candidatus Binatia bacterium]
MVAAQAIVEADGLVKRYGARAAVDGLSFAVAAGECVGLLGPNGAGKTTTIRMVTCYTMPTAGALRVLGLPVIPANHPPIKVRLGIVQQEDSLDPDLGVEKNLTVFARYFGIPSREAARRAAELVRFAELEGYRAARIGTLSGGMRRRLMLARALVNEPTMLVLDEPTTGLDPQARRLVWERIRTLKRQGTTILLTTHYMEEAAQLCDRVIIIDRGRIVAEGIPAELVREHVGVEVVEIALGDDGAVDPVRLARLGGGPWRTEQVGDVLYLYVSRLGAEPPLDVLADVEFTRRRATLEDVFLTLTGHGLRE